MTFPLDLFHALLPVADSLTKGLQCLVKLEAYTGQGANGRTYAAPVYLSAIVDLSNKQIVRADGKVTTIAATITVIGDVAPNGSTTVPPRREPIDPKDRVTLPNGFTGPIVDVPGAPLDPSTNRGLIHVITLGAV